MTDLDRRVTLEIDLDVAGIDAGADRFNAAVGKMAAGGPKIAEGFNTVDPAITRLNKQMLEMGVRLQQTGQISARSLATVGVSLKSLEQEYGRTASATDRLTKGERAWLTEAQGAYKGAIGRLREYNDQLQKVSRQTRDFTSLQGALEGMGGTFGQIAKTVGQVGTALTAGIAIGRQLDQWLTQNVQGWQDWKNKAADAIVGVYQKLDDLYRGRPTNASTAPITAKGAETRFLIDLEMALKSHGIKTFADATAAVSKFRDGLAALKVAGYDSAQYIEQQSSGIKEMVATFKAAGKEVPADIQAIANSLEKTAATGSKATKSWTSDLDQLQAALANTVRNVEDQLAAGIPYGQVIEANKGKLSGLYDQTLLYNQALSEQTREWLLAGKAAQDYGKQLPLGQTFKAFTEEAFAEQDERARADEKAQRDRQADQARFNEQEREKWQKAMEESAESLSAALDKFSTEMADVFTAGVIGGAEGFADAASRLFLQGVNDGAKGIFTNLAKIAFGAPPDQKDFEDSDEGRKKYAQAVIDSNKQSEAILGAVSTVVGSVGQTMQIFEQAKKGQETSVLATTLAFTAAGAAIGGWIGALVGAIAGLTISLLANAKAKKEQPYAAYGIENGVPYVEAFAGKERQFENITAAMYNDMISQMANTLESTQNDYIKLLMKFPDAVADSITAANFAPTMDKYKEKGLGFMHWLVRVLFPIEATIASLTSNKYRGNMQHLVTEEGDIGNPLWDKNAQKNFMQDFQNWVNNTLPKAIIASFEEPLMKGFETLGLTAEKFSQIWDRIQAIDPKDAIKTLNDLYDALSAFKGAEEFLSQRIYGGAGFEFNTPGLIGQGAIDNNKPFQDALAQADAGLVAMGATIENLIGPEQIAQAKTWGNALLQRQQAVQQFFQQVAAAIDSVIKGYQSSIRDLELQGMVTKEGTPDVGAQTSYLKKYADSLYQQIQNAPTIEAATALSNELQNVILRIQQIGGAQSAEAAEAYRLWAIEQLKSAQALVVTRLQELAQAVADQNAAFLDAIQGFIDAFRNAADELTGETTEDNGGADDGETPGNEPNTGGRPYWVDADQGYGGVGYQALKPWERPFNERGRDPEMSPPPPGGNLLAFPTPPPQPDVNLRVLIRQNEEILAIMRTGRDYKVSTRLVIESEGAPQEIDTTPDDDEGGFVRRELAARGR